MVVTKPCRRVLLLVNPIGGKGKSRAIVKEKVMPILEAAGCIVDLRGMPHSASFVTSTDFRDQVQRACPGYRQRGRRETLRVSFDHSIHDEC